MRDLFVTKIYKLGVIQETDTLKQEILNVFTMKTKVKPKQQTTLLLCLKSKNIKIPKYLLFKIFDEFNQIIVFTKTNLIFPFSNGLLGGPIEVQDKKFTEIIQKNYLKFFQLDESKIFGVLKDTSVKNF